jgi:replicative DNA helicase Mcm
MPVEKIYNMFENVRKKCSTYKKNKYDKECEYKELIKLILDREELTEAELMLKASNLGLRELYYNAFVSILKNYLSFIEYGEKEGFKTIKITNELREFLQEQSQGTKGDEWDELLRKYGSYIDKYIKELVVTPNTDKKIKVSLNELHNNGLMEFVDYAIENYEKVRDFLREKYDEFYFLKHGEANENPLVMYDFPEKSISKIKLNEICSSYIDRVVEFEANIIHASKIMAVKRKSVYVCPNCGKIQTVYFQNVFDDRGKVQCSCNAVMKEDERQAKWADFQELLVQPISYLDGVKPREQVVLYENTEGIYEGDVKIVGYVKVLKNGKKNAYDLVVHALHIQPIQPTLDLKEEDIEKIEKVAKHPKIIDILSNELIPEIKGYEIIKKAIFLQQVKGVKKGNKRGDSHILLITDPGIGKSVMLRKIAELPGNMYGSMTTASGVGLTAAVVREKTAIRENWVLKPGLLVRANKGTACIDEFMVRKNIQDDLLEAMESQTIHINKGGINAKLRTECAILAACNPRWGRFNPDVSIPEQINIPAPLLSRFDIIFPIKDEVSRARDKDIAQHILDIHRKYLKQEIGDEKKKSTININGVDIDDEFIIKYIMYAREKKPILSERVDKIFKNYYAELRQSMKETTPFTARQLEAAIRLAEAHAKAKLKDVVEEEDAQEAINIINEALKEVAYDPETGKYDIGKIIGESSKDRDKMREIYSIIKKLSEKSGESEALVMHEDIVEEAEKKGMDEDTVYKMLKKLIKRGDIDEPRYGKYRLL